MEQSNRKIAHATLATAITLTQLPIQALANEMDYEAENLIISEEVLERLAIETDALNDTVVAEEIADSADSTVGEEVLEEALRDELEVLPIEPLTEGGLIYLILLFQKKWIFIRWSILKMLN